MSTSRSSNPIRFGDFEVDPRAGELRKHGRLIKLQKQPIQLLLLLLEHPGEVVSREEARNSLWKEDTFVDFDHGLGAALNRLRAALGDSASDPRFIETLPRHGYRFILPVEGAVSSEDTAASDGSRERVRGRARSALRYAAAGTLAAAVLIGVAYLAQRQLSPIPIPAQGKVMLAVLPLDNLDGDPERDYFSDGLTEEIITHLGQVNPRRLGVIARSSVMGYKESGKTIEQIGRELGVSYVLEGSVRREGQRVRITAQLIEVGDQTHLWAQTYDRDLDEIMTLQSDVSRRISQALAVEVLPATEGTPSRAAVVHPAAHEAYLKGIYFRNTMTEEGYRKGIEYFKEAVELHNTYAAAYAGMAGCHCLLSGHGLEVLPPKEAMPVAKLAALKALELDDRLAEAHAVMGMVHMKFDWDFEAAEKDFRRAIELNSSYAQAYLWYSLFLQAMGRQEDAVSRARTARELSPLSLETNVNLGLQLLEVGRYDEAVEQIGQAIELNPRSWGAHWGLGICYRQTGKYSEAAEEFEKAVALSGGNAVSVASLGHAYAVAGQRSEALRILGELNARRKEMYVSPAFLAYITRHSARQITRFGCWNKLTNSALATLFG